MHTHWGFDFWTTNSVLAAFEGGVTSVVALDRLSARGHALAGGEDGECPAITSVVEVLDPRGRRAIVGQEAVARNWASPAPNLARSFKLELASAADRSVCT